MTVTAIRPHLTADLAPTAESENLAALRAMLDDPAEQPNWPEIRAAIDYLIADTFVRDLAV